MEIYFVQKGFVVYDKAHFFKQIELIEEQCYWALVAEKALIKKFKLLIRYYRTIRS